MYEVFEHTADVGLRVSASTEEGLFVEAARAFVSLIVRDPASVRRDHVETVRIEGEDRELLLFDWLSELLYLFDARHLLLVEFEARRTAHGLEAVARGERYDPERHRLDHEVKAVTYHGLQVQRTDEGWEAEVILDI